MELEEKQLWEQVIQKIHPQSRLRQAWELKGGISAQITALEFEQADGQSGKVVVRQHGELDRRTQPQIASIEYRLLEILQTVGVPTPKPYFLDETGQIFPHPYLVMEFVEGKMELTLAHLPEQLRKAAVQLAKIHSADYSKLDLTFLPKQAEIYAAKFSQRPLRLDDSLDEGKIRAVLEKVWPLPQTNPPVLLHGDYWPNNLLWQDGELAAVLDWEDTQYGDPLADFANSRLEMLWAGGPEIMQKFSDHYKTEIDLDFRNLPYWDLCAALKPAFRIAEWAGDPVSEQAMRAGHKLFVTQAFEQLAKLD